MVTEWVVPVGVAVGKMLLRASGQLDIADAVGDAQEGWRRLQRRQRQPDVIGKAIADRLEKRAAALTNQHGAQDLAATAQNVADLISRLAEDDEAIRLAAAHPEQFLAYAKRQGGEKLRRLTPRGATPLFDKILEAAATEFAALAPSSSRFVSAGLTEVLRQAEASPELSVVDGSIGAVAVDPRLIETLAEFTNALNRLRGRRSVRAMNQTLARFAPRPGVLIDARASEIRHGRAGDAYQVRLWLLACGVLDQAELKAWEQARHRVRSRPNEWAPDSAEAYRLGGRRANDDRSSGHVFISYVAEDSEVVDRLQADLEEAGINVWRDRSSLGSGDRWKGAIRHAIESGTFFLCCFSEASRRRRKSYMYEELTVAIEELRARSRDQVWFLPVVFPGGDVPDWPVGAGESLRDFNYTMMRPDTWHVGIKHLVHAIQRDTKPF